MSAPQPIFYFNLGSPDCYMVAEQVMSALPVVPEWEPVPNFAAVAVDRERIERVASELGLQPLRWPEDWPPETWRAMLAATYAKRVGRAVAFSLAAFRQTFAAGRDLGDQNTVLIAAAACEMHPAAMLKGMELRSVADALRAAEVRAAEAGVPSLPAIQVDDRVFEGLESIELATAALGELA